MTSGAYLLGAVELFVFVAAIAFSAYRLRCRLLPHWLGSAARLAEAILALSIVICLSQLLGAVGLFAEVPLLIGAAAAAVGSSRLELPVRGPESQPRALRPALWPSRSIAVAAAIATSLVVLAAWMPSAAPMFENGIWNWDSMWYRLPAAARFAETGSLTSLHFYSPVYAWWFLPANGEVLHAIGFAFFDRDVLSPLLNFGWLGLALLGAWSVGRTYGAAALSVIAIAVILLTPILIDTQAGRGRSDLASIALLIALAAILINGARVAESRGPVGAFPIAAVSVAGLAGGLAVGTRPNVIPILAVVTVGLLWLSERGKRRVIALAWLGPVALTGGFWYLRNLVATGNPVPLLGLKVGPLSLPETEHGLEFYSDIRIADRITDGDIWENYFFPGFEYVFGDLWWLVLALPLAGIVGAALARETPMRGVLGAAALLGVVAHVFTPYSATGVADEPTRFAFTLRYALPALGLGLVLAPTLYAARTTRARFAVAGLLLLAAASVLATTRLLNGERLEVALLVVAVVAAVVIAAIVAVGRTSRLEIAALACVVIIGGTAIYWPIARSYLDNRYTSVWPGLDHDVAASFEWANDVSDARIAINGTVAGFLQYGYYGRDLSNTVEYVGRRGPRGSFAPIESCEEWRAAVNDGDFDYLVTTGTMSTVPGGQPGHAPERDWLGDDPAAQLVLADGPTAVFQLTGPLAPDC